MDGVVILSLFKINYDKPGRGVEKDEPEKSAVMNFFTIFFRRLSKFVQLNFIFMIPCALIAALMFGLFLLPVPRYEMALTLSSSIIKLQLWEVYVVPMPIVLLAPFYAGVMVVVRRMANKEYVFPWAEYWQGVKDNWKQFLINGIFCYIAYVVLSFSIIYYSGELSSGWFNFIPFALVLILVVLLVFSQLYAPVLMVSVDIKLKPLYKNSLIFAIMGVFRNILIVVLYVALLFLYFYVVPMMGLTLLIGFALLITIIPVFVAYINVYICYPMIDSYIIKPYEKKEEVKNDPVVQPSTEDFKYIADELDENRDESEYVYYNGRLVKRDEINKDD